MIEDKLVSREVYQKEVLNNKDEIDRSINRINELLAHKSVGDMVEFLQIFQDEAFRKRCVSNSDELMHACLFSMITIDEIQSIGGPSFIMNADSLDGLICIFKCIKFLLWEMEFNIDNSTEDTIKAMKDSIVLSEEAMSAIVRAVAVDIDAMSARVNKLLWEK